MRRRLLTALAALHLAGAGAAAQPAAVDVTEATVTALDSTGPGNNRRLSPVIDFPAISVPAGFTPDGLPMGLELMARPFAEATLFRLAYAYEQGTKHRRPSPRPPPLGATAR